MQFFLFYQPWRLPGDMAHFKRVTSTPPCPGKTNAVIMGRKTWESIPSKFRPLDGRTNVILTRDPSKVVVPDTADQVVVATSLKEATQKLAALEGVGDIFVIGGGEVYQEAINTGLINRVLYTEVSGLSDDFQFDTFFPELNNDDWECQPYVLLDDTEEKKEENEIIHTDEKTGLQYRFLDYRAKALKVNAADEILESNLEEMQYLDLCREIILKGVQRGDRTGTGTLSKFGTQMRFSLRDGTLPLLTTKRVFWRGVAEELLWFIQVCQFLNEMHFLY